jgi:hypothetical protein
MYTGNGKVGLLDDVETFDCFPLFSFVTERVNNAKCTLLRGLLC